VTLNDKTIVIIGGTGGLGLSAARALAAADARLVIVGRDPDDAAQAVAELGTGRSASLVADAVVPETAERAIEIAVERFGRLDALYHVAGGSGRAKGDGPLGEIGDEAIDYTVDLNLKSAIYSSRAAVRQFLRQSSGGSILNMTSVLAFSPAPVHFATHVYAATKAAVIGLTKSAAAYYARYNIRFNAIAPALVETPMSQRAIGDQAILDFIQHKQPLDGGRVGRPSDLDGAAVFFLSDASKFVTGQVLAVDGGWCVSDGVPAP
jgi:NAD(P)-dependent dehydrogenase (short-subunit alcohol dehydrogenase family)